MTDAAHYRDKAQQCRRLARDVGARDVAERLLGLAEEYEAEAEAVDEPAKAQDRPDPHRA